MRRYFITGGTGFIGRALVRHLLSLPETDKIVCLTRGRDDLIEHKKVSYWRGDITEVALPAPKFTDVIHAAAEANDLLQPDQHKYYYSIVEGARRVFEWAADASMRVLFVSSGCVRKGDSVYCRAKRMSEWLSDRYPVPIKIARVFSVAGEEMPLNGQYALGRFIHGAVFEGCVSYYGGGSIRSYLHVNDVAAWLKSILDWGIDSYPYDVGAVRPISISDLALLVGRIAGVPVKEIESTDFRPANIYLPNAVDTKAKLQVRETVSLEEAIGRTLDHVRNTRVQAA